MLAQIETGARGRDVAFHISRTLRKYMELEWFHCRLPTHREQCMDRNADSTPFLILCTKQ